MKIGRVRSLRFKLSWMHGLVISLFIVCVGLVRYQIVSYRAHRGFDQDLLQDAQFFVARLSIRPDAIVWSTQGLTPAGILKMEEFRSYFVVTDTRDKILQVDFHSPFLQQMLGRKDMEAILHLKSGFGQATDADGENYRFVNIPYPDRGEPRYIVHLGRSTSEMADVLNEYRMLYIYSVPLMLLTSAGVGWFLAGRALKPFAEIARAAGQITSENLSMQIVTQHQEQEVQGLVKSFNAMVARLERSFRQMRQFNADAAHELRTPLAIIQGENEIALRSPSLSEEIRAVLVSNLEELERLTRIVNDMLTLAEAEAGNQVLVKKPIGLSPLFHDLVDQVRLLATDRDIRVEVQDMPAVLIEADELWIRRAFLNLLDNSIKYSKDGGLIQIRGVIQGSSIRVAVQDSGIGIAQEDLPRIFDRLYRADPARGRASGGAGLGLSLVRWIIEAHSGQIFVKSVPDKGTTFEIALPLVSTAAH